MKIRNVLEEAVFQLIEEVLSEDQRTGSPAYIFSEQCRVDAACYVLNRASPRYISSARGQTYADSEHHLNPQLEIDLLALVHEGLKRVTTVQRSYYSSEGGRFSPLQGRFFHLPVIKGRLLHGLSFEPVMDTDVYLLIDGTTAEMIDANWQNPYPVAEQTNGAYAFWPAPIAAKETEEHVRFSCELRIKDHRFEPMHHCFSLDISARATRHNDLVSGTDYRIPDMYVLPRE